MPPLLTCRWRDRERGEGGDASETLVQTHARNYAALVTWSLSPSSGREICSCPSTGDLERLTYQPQETD